MFMTIADQEVAVDQVPPSEPVNTPAVEAADPAAE